jgi:hypothetical protein
MILGWVRRDDVHMARVIQRPAQLWGEHLRRLFVLSEDWLCVLQRNVNRLPIAQSLSGHDVDIVNRRN